MEIYFSLKIEIHFLANCWLQCFRCCHWPGINLPHQYSYFVHIQCAILVMIFQIKDSHYIINEKLITLLSKRHRWYDWVTHLYCGIRWWHLFIFVEMRYQLFDRWALNRFHILLFLKFLQCPMNFKHFLRKQTFICEFYTKFYSLSWLTSIVKR